MSKINDLIQQYCPQGIIFKELWEVTIWDKRFNGVDKSKQLKVSSYKHVSSAILKSLKKERGTVKLLSTGKFDGWTTEIEAGSNLNFGEVITIPSGGTANIKYYNGKFVDSGNILAKAFDKTISLKFIYYYLLSKNEIVESFFRGAGVKHPNMTDLLKLQIPIPLLPIQEEIVAILDKFTTLEAELEAELEARKKQYTFYRDSLLCFEGKDVKWMTLGEIGNVCMCKRVFKNETTSSGDIPFYKIGTFGKEPDSFISKELYQEYKNRYSFPKKGDILISASGTIGRTVIYNGEPAYFQDSNIVWINNDESIVTNRFLFHYYKVVKWQTDNGGIISRLYNDNLKKTKIPIPTFLEQERIVKILDKFDILVNDISIGLPAEIKTRRRQNEFYRNQLLTFNSVSNE